MADQEEEMLRRTLIRAIRGYAFERLSTESLERIYKLVHEEPRAAQVPHVREPGYTIWLDPIAPQEGADHE